MHYRVERKCSKLLHNAVIIGIRLLTFASSIRQRVPRDLITLCFIILRLNIYTKSKLQITDVDELKIRLIDECRAQFDQLIVSRRYQPVALSS